MKKTITVIEHEKLIKGENISDTQYDLLEKFILANSEKNDDGEKANLMTITQSNGKKAISARQYVGTITLKDGTNIEILPKIYRDSGVEEKKEVKKIFRDMLRSLYNAKSISQQSADLEVDKLPLFEIFIRMFLDEASTIIKRGLKGGYDTVESNENFLKGKLLLNKHIRENYIHKEKFYVQYDEFNTNQPENRLIKSTLVYLDKRTKSVKNKQFVKNLLAMTDEVPYSKNYDADFAASKAIKSRNGNAYVTALAWSEVFLKGKTFTTFAGEQYAKAILFDMNELFESYIAKKVGQYLQRESLPYKLSVQDRSYHLFKEPRRFELRPDMVITDSSVGTTYILDTKWKILKKGKSNDGISQSDMYQMYAYFKEYEAHSKKPKSVTLVYPYSDIKLENDIYKNGNVIVKVCFVDLTNIDESIRRLAEVTIK